MSNAVSAGSPVTLRSSSPDAETFEIEDDDNEKADAVLQRRPTYDRTRTAVVEKSKSSESGSTQLQLVDVYDDINFGKYVREHIFKTNNIYDDNERFLAKMRSRFDNAGVEIPTVEVRYENLTIRGMVRVGSRALPTLFNTVLDFLDSVLTRLKISATKRRELTILEGVSGILKPGRMTLLLGPPSSGKTTLLSTLSGMRDPSLEMVGDITYNGYKLEEFEPKKTAAYISQDDVHIPEFTVRETMEFSARYQGVGSQYDLLRELVRKEKELGISADSEVDLFMKASTTKGLSQGLLTEYYMKMMGLDICADTVVGNHLIKGISGGQRKRLTPWEMIVGPARVLFMDDISTGLTARQRSSCQVPRPACIYTTKDHSDFSAAASARNLRPLL